MQGHMLVAYFCTLNPQAFINLLTCYVIKLRVLKGRTNMQSYIKAAEVVLPGDGGGLPLKLDFMT